jgi:hypothetical protein
MSDPRLCYNTDVAFWQNTAKAYRELPDGGPTLRVLEGNLWSIPGHFVNARFESTGEGEKVLLAAGFKFVPAEKGFRA